MPELPEVETLARKLDQLAAGKRIEALQVGSVAALKTFDPPVGSLTGLPVKLVRRRGKFLIFEIALFSLVVHFARGGWIRWHAQASATIPGPRGPLAARLRFAGGEALDFTEHGKQKRLALYLVSEINEIAGIARLGIDVLDSEFTAARLKQLLQGQSSNLKTALADQTLLAGIGNAYSDEILHAAQVSPFARPASLDDATLARIHHTIGTVLTQAINREQDLDVSQIKGDKRENLQVHGRTGEACPVCGDTIREVAFATRSFQYCPTCQTGGKIYADRRLSRLIR